MSKTKTYTTVLAVDGLELPLHISLERRRDTRYGITSKRVTLRMPLSSSPEYIQRQHSELRQWVSQQFKIRPTLRVPFDVREYKSGDVLTVGKRQYVLDVQHEDRATHTARLIANTISLQLSVRSTPLQRQRSIKTLLSRVVAGDFYPEIARRVHDWNQRTVNQPIKNIYLKYNATNWGSCSAHGNVNLSTRLLFAPDSVQDYVIVHELAHLVELNHSDRFWAIVEKHMPDYKEREKWLRVNRGKCDF